MPHASIWTLAIATALFAGLADAQQLRAQRWPGAPALKVPAEDDREKGLFVAPIGGAAANADEFARGYGAGLRLLPDEGTYVGYQVGNWTVGSALHRETELERNTWLDMGASYGFNINRKHRISVDGGVSLRAMGEPDGAELQDAFASFPGQSTEPGAGFRLSWHYNFARRHSLSTMLGFDHRFDLNEGPEAERNAATFGTVYGYRFE